MAVQSTTVADAAAPHPGGATSHLLAQSARDATHRRPVAARLDERRGRGPGEMLLLIGLAAVAGPLAVVVLATITLAAVVLAGPFLLMGILAIAFSVGALAAIGAAG